MNLPEFSVRHPVTVSMIMLAICLLGIISLYRLGTDLLPAIYNPRIVVEIQAGERSPQEMEQRFARRLEGDLGTISKVIDVRSVCRLGRVIATATFSWGTDMDFALLDIQKKAVSYESDPEVERVTIARYDPQEEPILTYALQSKGERDLDELRRIAENVVKRNLERLDGVARAQTHGGIKREVRVELDSYLLQAYSLAPADISTKIRQANADASGGRLMQDDKAYLIRGIGKYENIEEVAATVVGYKVRGELASNDSSATGAQQSGGRYVAGKVPIYLSDVARVYFAPEERTEVVRVNGEECVGIFVYKESQENTVRVADQVRETIAGMEAGFPDLEFRLIHSHASFIASAIGEVKITAMAGIFLAVLVLYAFLRHLGATFIISLAIPISILATFTLMYFQSLTLNLMTLGGLALGAGMLVDNAIVVIENIFRRRQLGESADLAASEGTSEVAVAIIASTITTVIVFLPIIYVRGIAAELFREQAWVVAISLLSSLLVAFLLIPALAARLFKDEAKSLHRQRLRIPFYDRLLKWALSHPMTIVASAIILIAVAALLLPIVGAEFVPRTDENQVEIDLGLQPGTPLEQTSAVLAGAEERIAQLLDGQVSEVFSTVNVQTSQSLFKSSDEQSEHRASIALNLKKAAGLNAVAAVELLRPQLELPEVETVFRIKQTSLQQTIGTGGAPIVVEIRGPEMETLNEIGTRVAEALRSIAGLHTIEMSFESSRPEISLQVDRLLAASFGLDVTQISNRVRERLSGEVVSDFYSAGEERSIRVRFPNTTLNELENLEIKTADGALLRLKDICKMGLAEGPREIHRHNQSRIAHVTAHHQKTLPLSDAIAEVDGALATLLLPPGYELRFTGEEASRQDSFDQLRLALWLSILLVYMVLASLFESFLHPFTILLTLPLAGVGVVFAFLIIGEPLSVMAFIGIIMLAGIAGNDSIVLVDYINRLRSSGEAIHQAIVRAAQDRLRPILMTTATTILALLPLTIGIGEGARLRAPMAVAVIGGLVTSTILTLVVIPVVYGMFERAREKGARALKGRDFSA